MPSTESGGPLPALAHEACPDGWPSCRAPPAESDWPAHLGVRGAQVIIAGIDATAGQVSADELRAIGISATFTQLDVSDVAAIRRCVSSVDAEHGRLDVLVNNAGILSVSRDRGRDRAAVRPHAANSISKGTFFLSQAAVPIVKRQRSRRIVNVASVSARGRWRHASVAVCRVESPALSVSPRLSPAI